MIVPLCTLFLFHTGTGLGLVITPSIAIVSRYFTTKYPIANGITNAGVGLGSSIFPPIFRLLITTYGWRGAAVITGGICLQMCWCAALYRPMKLHGQESTPESTRLINSSTISNQESTSSNNFVNTFKNKTLNVLKNQKHFFVQYPLFMLLVVSASSFFISYINFQLFLPKVMEDLGYSSSKAALILTVAGALSTFARLTYWIILSVTKMSPVLLFTYSILLSAVPMLCFPLFNSYEVILLSVVPYGLAVGSANALNYLSSKVLVDSAQHHVIALGWQMLFQGGGQIIGGYLCGKFKFSLLKVTQLRDCLV